VALSAAETAVGFFEGQILLDRYDVRYRIGLGSTGAVYAAYDLSAQKNLAIKVLLPRCLKDDAVRQHFAAELKVASYLSHPNIALVYDLHQEGAAEFVTMELLKGRTLREEMVARKRSRQRFTPRETARVGMALCDALQYAHKYILHRSIRPENVFLCDDGTVKLMDFAMASLETATDAGSPYLAPEQRSTGAPVDQRIDQYGVGAVLYEMLTGEPPGTSTRSAAASGVDVPGPLSAAVERALQPSPERRFPDMRAFGAQLAVVQARLRVPRWAWATVALVALALVGVVTYFVQRPKGGDEEPAVVAAEARRAATGAAAEAARLATVRERAEAERLAAERAKAEAERAATLAQAEVERVTTMRAQAEAEQVAAAERAREEAARLTATRAAAALERAEAEARAAEEERVATRREAEARRTATAVARAEAQREATALAQAEVDRRATARAGAEQARVATADARVEERRVATERALADQRQRTARAVVQSNARAMATARQAEMDGRKNYIPSLNATVTSLRFFEKPRGEQLPEGKREYADRFKASKTHAVYWEITLEHPPLGRRKAFTIRSVCYGPNGNVFGEGELKTYVEPNWGKSTHIYGWGFDEPGHWEDGKYKVELFVGGKKVASGSFEIYSGFF